MNLAGSLMLKVANEDCVLFLNIGDNSDYPTKGFDVVKEFEKPGWILVQDIIWMKSFKGIGHFQSISGDKRLNSIYEHVFMLVKNKNKYSLDRLSIGEPYKYKSNIKRFKHSQDCRCAGNVWLIPYETVNKQLVKNHPAVFPKELAIRCLKLNNLKGPVLDPFAGTCTVARACEELNIDYTMIDIVPENINIGRILIDSDKKSRTYP